MSGSPAEQASRTKTLSLTCTPYEHQAVRALARLREIPISDLLREKRLAELVREYEEAVDVLNGTR